MRQAAVTAPISRSGSCRSVRSRLIRCRLVADTPLAGAVATTKTTIGNTGGNQSSQSGGVAQVGGDNTATGSVGVLQVSHSESNTGVAGRVVGTHVGADAGALIGGNGTNTANGSAVEVQVGSGNTANGSTAALQVQPSTAGVGIRADAGRLAPALKANVSISANEVLGRALGIDLSMLGASPGPATVFILDIVHALVPGVSDEVGLQRLIDLGVLQVGGNSDDVRIDLGALGIKVVSLVRDPEVTVTLFGTTLTAGGLFGGPNTGVPTVTDSLGTVQAGGGNAAIDSVGVAQIGSLVAAPKARLQSNELGTSLALGGSSGVPSGNNSVDSSAGVVQVGGASAAPTLSAGVLGIGSASLGGSSGIVGGNNTATDSIGVAQIGGGNNANGAVAAVQAGAVTVAPTASGSLDPLDTTLGISGESGIGGGGNTATE